MPDRGLIDPGPINNPVDKFAHLPEEVREWLEQLRPQDIADIREAMEFTRSARTVGRFGKWAIITTVSTFTAAVVLGEKLLIVWKWFTGAPK